MTPSASKKSPGMALFIALTVVLITSIAAMTHAQALRMSIKSEKAQGLAAVRRTVQSDAGHLARLLGREGRHTLHLEHTHLPYQRELHWHGELNLDDTRLRYIIAGDHVTHMNSFAVYNKTFFIEIKTWR